MAGMASVADALHEAGRKPAEAAIAERRIRFAFAQIGEIDAEIAEGGFEHRQQPILFRHR